jgi:5-dehydro-2-deoxygluconokinase
MGEFAVAEAQLDVIAIGRSSVDLYGQQVGGRLEDMSTFSKAVGGCPTNIAVGAARLGLKSGLLTRVGDEHMGRFIREQCAREGVDTRGIHTDPARLTALVLLGVRDEKSFPLIFYRDNCADSALDESDVEEDYIASAKAIVVTGTHFARPNTEAAQRRAIAIAKRHKRKVVFDIDFRPNLWGLAGHGAGEERYLKSEKVSDHLRGLLASCDLIVGTEEEVMIAGGGDDPLAALRNIRAHSQATIVMKRGPMGCVVYPGEIPERIEDGVKGPGFPVEVYNVLGAGDAFMAGFLRGWLRDEPLERCCAFANAGGAFAVSRLLCSSDYATWIEMENFLAHGSSERALRKDAALNHIHWASTRDRSTATIMALAIDHRAQLERIADDVGASRDRIARFKELAVVAAARVANGRPGFGMLLDDRYGREALFRAMDHNFWIGRPIEEPGSRPLDFEFGGSLAARLIEWPKNHTVKCLCFVHPDDPPDMRARQEREVSRAFDAARRTGHEFLLEIIASKNGPIGDGTIAEIQSRLYAIGIKPDWWKLEAQATSKAWRAITDAIESNDPLCRGVVLLGLDASVVELSAAFSIAKEHSIVKGFAVGRTIFAEPAAKWLSGKFNDESAVAAMAETFSTLCAMWIGPGGGELKL